MRTTRQQYIDSNLQAAREAGCDCIQLKYDGWWARSVIDGGAATVFTRTGRELPNFSYRVHPPCSCVVIGELMHGTNWAQDTQLLNKQFLFDVWSVDEVDMTGAPYRDRYSLLKALHKRFNGSFILVANFPIQQYENIWRKFVVEDGYEGVVFRNSKAPVDAPVYRQKNVVLSVETAVDFVEGEGKFANMLGAVVCESGLRVGGGWNDEERLEIWQHPERFKNKRFEAEGRKRFAESGLLRHPNFVRWL